MTSDSANQRFSNIQILPSVDEKAITNLTNNLEQNGNYFFFFRYFFMQTEFGKKSEITRTGANLIALSIDKLKLSPSLP